jgi:ABC-type nitrate/sulfonate/bicarbonate transport systems periplasmic components-like protein
MDRRSFLKLAGFIPAAALFGCSGTDQEKPQENTSEEKKKSEPVAVRVATLKGPTAMGLVKFMSEVEAQNITDNNYSFEILDAPDQVVAKVAQGDVDVASIPANLAATLFNKTKGAYKVACLNVLNVLYIVETGNAISKFADLKGKTLYASGKGAVPEYALSYLLSKNGMTLGEDVQVEWKSEHTECVAALAQDSEGIALLPQPFVTVAQTKNSQIRAAIDLGAEWEAINPQSKLIAGVTIISSKLISDSPDAVTALLSHYKDSVEFAVDHPDDAATLVGKYGIVPEPIAKVALPKCNITYIDGADMKTALSSYLGILDEANPQSVGGQVPGDDFYFGA